MEGSGMELQVHLMPKATSFSTSMPLLLKFFHWVSLTAKENEAQTQGWSGAVSNCSFDTLCYRSKIYKKLSFKGILHPHLFKYDKIIYYHLK